MVKWLPILQFGAFVVGFIGIVAFYCLYGEQTVLDSVFFVVLTVTTVGKNRALQLRLHRKTCDYS